MVSAVVDVTEYFSLFLTLAPLAIAIRSTFSAPSSNKRIFYAFNSIRVEYLGFVYDYYL